MSKNRKRFVPIGSCLPFISSWFLCIILLFGSGQCFHLFNSWKCFAASLWQYPIGIMLLVSISIEKSGSFVFFVNAVSFIISLIQQSFIPATLIMLCLYRKSYFVPFVTSPSMVLYTSSAWNKSLMAKWPYWNTLSHFGSLAWNIYGMHNVSHHFFNWPRISPQEFEMQRVP